MRKFRMPLPSASGDPPDLRRSRVARPVPPGEVAAGVVLGLGGAGLPLWLGLVRWEAVRVDRRGPGGRASVRWA